MSLSFNAGYVQAKESHRQSLQKDIENFLAAGGQPTVVESNSSAYDYCGGKTQKQLNDERKAKKNLDGKPVQDKRRGRPLSIKTMGEVVKRNRSRNG